MACAAQSKGCLCPGNSQHCLMASQEGSIGQSMGYFWVGAVRGDPKPKEVPQVYPKQLPAPFLCEQEELMEAGECFPLPHKLTWNACSLPTGHTPTLNVLREFFISATFSSMAQRQLLTFSSRAYSPCWIRDSSCIASVKPAFSSEANACNYSNHKHSGFSPSSQAQVFVSPRVTQLAHRLHVTHPVRCCPLSPPPFMAGKHGERFGPCCSLSTE